MNIYKEKLIEHYKNPHNFGTLENPDFSSDLVNPSCGDAVMMQGIVHNNVLSDVRFSGQGCVISQASASLLTDYIKGQSLDAIMQIDKQQILDLINIPLGPLRLECALLPLHALKKGITTFLTTKQHA